MSSLANGFALVPVRMLILLRHYSSASTCGAVLPKLIRIKPKKIHIL
jgi:hypothetical protein